MADQFLYALSDTWNSSITTYVAIGMDVTDTASAEDSKLLLLSVGGTAMFTVDKAGNVTGSSFTGNVTGGEISDLSAPLPVADGGTGAITAEAARTALGTHDAANLTAGTLPAARFNDTAHGTRAGGNLHALATGSAAGFMSAAHYTAVQGLGTVASRNVGVANATDIPDRAAADARYMPAGASVQISRYTSGETAIALGSLITLTHDLGGVPDVIRGQLINRSAGAIEGWAVGEGPEIGLPDYGNTGYWWDVRRSSTQVQVLPATALIIPNKTSGVVVSGSSADWRLVVTALRWS